MNRSELGFALFLSIVPGLGVTAYGIRMLGDPFDPIVAGTSIVTTVAIFLLVVASVSVGSPDEEFDAEIES